MKKVILCGKVKNLPHLMIIPLLWKSITKMLKLNKRLPIYKNSKRVIVHKKFNKRWR